MKDVLESLIHYVDVIRLLNVLEPDCPKSATEPATSLCRDGVEVDSLSVVVA
jgi:hypothetical protein